MAAVVSCALAITIGVLAVGCGSANRTVTTGAGSDDQAVLDFVHCIRRHGISMPDPAHRPGHTGLSLMLPTGASGNASFRAAQQSCQHLLDGTNMGRKMAFADSPALEEFNLHLAQCLRAHGIDVADPTPERPDPEGVGRVERATPAFQAADQACRQQIAMPTMPTPASTP